ncbi:cyclic peptide export ABC transporter [Deltaproteobacteria bacterium TL4]
MILITSIIASISYVIFLVTITASAELTVRQKQVDYRDAITALICLLVYLVFKQISFQKSYRLGTSALTDLQVRIVTKLNDTVLKDLEKIESSEIHVAFALDSESVSYSLQILTMIFFAITTFIIGITYLFWLSPLLMIPVILIFIGGYYLPLLLHHKTQEIGFQLIEHETHFFGLFNQLLQGFKELKIYAHKSKDLLANHILPTLQKIVPLKKQSMSLTGSAIISEYFFFYLNFAVILYIFPQFSQHNGIITIVGLFMVLWAFYMQVIMSFPYLTKASFALERLYAFEEKLERATQVPHIKKYIPKTIQSLELKEVSFDYTDIEGSKTFHIGPITLDIVPNEILFISGGNGSGKSTLLKIITGLYHPVSGQILLNGKHISKESHRELFSAVFSDFHLFQRLYGIPDPDLSKADRLLYHLELFHKTKIVDRAFTNLLLSTGQKKRLALIATSLEDRPFYVFDEWAAEQDPQFREFFYEVFLMELQRAGKTIICTTHDERYFHKADRLLRMELGQIVSNQVIRNI